LRPYRERRGGRKQALKEELLARRRDGRGRAALDRGPFGQHQVEALEASACLGDGSIVDDDVIRQKPDDRARREEDIGGRGARIWAIVEVGRVRLGVDMKKTVAERDLGIAGVEVEDVLAAALVDRGLEPYDRGGVQRIVL